MIETLILLSGALLGIVIWVLLGEEWWGFLIIAAIVLTIVAVMYKIVEWSLT
jgi:hypothetical protein